MKLNSPDKIVLGILQEIAYTNRLIAQTLTPLPTATIEIESADERKSVWEYMGESGQPIQVNMNMETRIAKPPKKKKKSSKSTS